MTFWSYRATRQQLARRPWPKYPHQWISRPAKAGELAQLALAARRNEAAAKEAVLEEVSDPLGIALVSLAARDSLDVVGVDDEERGLAFEDVVDRFPVGASGLHGDVGAAGLREPVGKGEEVIGHSAESGKFLMAAPTLGIGGEQAGYDGALVDIEAAAVWVDHVHGGFLLTRIWLRVARDALRTRFCLACSRRGGATNGGASRHAGTHCLAGSAHQEGTTSTPACSLRAYAKHGCAKGRDPAGSPPRVFVERQRESNPCFLLGREACHHNTLAAPERILSSLVAGRRPMSLCLGSRGSTTARRRSQHADAMPP